MRIRQVRPEFFTDPVVSRLSIDVRLTYIGLWCVADDAGWLILDLPHIATMLYPYESIRVRERRLGKASEQLQEAGRLVAFDCGCALIPKLTDHQKIGGNKSFTVRDRHQVHTVPDLSPGKLGRLSNGTLVAPARAPDGAGATDDEDEKAALRAAYARQGLPV